MIQTFMTDYFFNKKIIKSLKNNIKINKTNIIIGGYNSNTNSWHCIECGIDMGLCNPRQLCKKTYCENN
jgi:hypothetical protein